MNDKKNAQHNKIYKLSILLFLLLLLNSTKFYQRIDFSNSKLFSLTDITISTLNDVRETLSITYYMSEQIDRLYPQTQSVTDFLFLYASQNKNILLRFVDPHTESVENSLESVGVTPHQVEVQKNGEVVLDTVYSGIVLEYKGSTLVIPFVLSVSNLEYELTTRIQLLTAGIAQGVYILYGGNAAFETHYSYLMPWLEIAGISSIRINATDLPQLQVLYPLLVIGSHNFTDSDAFEIESFVQRGGSAIFASSATDVDLETWQIRLPQKESTLLNLLEVWGFSIDTNTVLDSQNRRITLQTQRSEEIEQLHYLDYPFFPKLTADNTENDLAKKSIVTDLVLYWPNSLQLNSMINQTILFNSSQESWRAEEHAINTDPFTTHSPQQGYNPSILGAYSQIRLPNYYTKASDISQRIPRIIVIPNEYFVSNLVQVTNNPQNLDFMVNLILWASYKDDLLDLRSKVAKDTIISNHSPENTVFTLLVLFSLPLFIAIIYVCFRFMRIHNLRKKYE